MSADASDLEDQIVSKFLESIDSNSDISDEIVEILVDRSEEDDFGGRKWIQARALEAKSIDEG